MILCHELTDSWPLPSPAKWPGAGSIFAPGTQNTIDMEFEVGYNRVCVGMSSNGRTYDSGSYYRGSSPCIPASFF